MNTRGVIHVSPAKGTKTLFHELAHELLFQDDEHHKYKTILDIEVESVAYAVSKYFGMDGLSSPYYVSLHGANAELILEHLERIRNFSAELIRGIEVESIDAEI